MHTRVWRSTLIFTIWYRNLSLSFWLVILTWISMTEISNPLQFSRTHMQCRWVDGITVSEPKNENWVCVTADCNSKLTFPYQMDVFVIIDFHRGIEMTRKHRKLLRIVSPTNSMTLIMNPVSELEIISNIYFTFAKTLLFVLEAGRCNLYFTLTYRKVEETWKTFDNWHTGESDDCESVDVAQFWK